MEFWGSIGAVFSAGVRNFSSIVNENKNETLNRNIEYKEQSISIVRYETFIEEIENKIIKRDYITSISSLGVLIGENMIVTKSEKISPIELIYDLSNLNDFAKVIINKASIILSSTDSFLDEWGKICDRESLKDESKKINATREFIKLCKIKGNSRERYKFIFWALMVLTVDKTDAEEKLSLICDFAKMLDIKDDEMRDIVNVIKYVYDRGNDKYRPKTAKVSEIFKGIYETEDNE